MQNKEYWEARAILKDKLLEKDIKKIEKKLLKHFKDTRKQVINELKIIYTDIESTEWAKYRIDSLLTSINRELDNLYHENEELLTRAFIDLYGTMSEEACVDLGIAFNIINTRLIEEAIKTNWSGLSFSERIWEHRRKLATSIKEELTKGLTRGDSLQDMARIVAKKFDTSFANAMRLVHTESAWVMNKATLDNYKDNDVKEYEFMAFLDEKTSKDCRKMDGRIIKVEEAIEGVNIPPLHCYCRSCIMPVLEH